MGEVGAMKGQGKGDGVTCSRVAGSTSTLWRELV